MERMRRGWYNPDSDRYYLILGFSLFLFVFVPLGFLAPRTFWTFLAIATPTAVVTILFSPSLGMLFVRRFFKKRFGFKPSRLAGMRVVEQQVVNEVLRVRAVKLDTSFSIGTVVQNPPPMKKPITVEDLKKREKKLRSAARTVKKAKRAFWDAHMLAKVLEYEVRERYSDYINL